MKHLQSFDEFINESEVNESEINIFDLVGKPLETIRASVEDLLKNSYQRIRRKLNLKNNSI